MTNEKTKKAATSAASTWMEHIAGSQRLIWEPLKQTSACDDWDKEEITDSALPGGLVQWRAERMASAVAEEVEGAAFVRRGFTKKGA